ncbi:hypothetical protein EG829_29110, partial [bacterium]|nr:hypothetical protein [bacterium]
MDLKEITPGWEKYRIIPPPTMAESGGTKPLSFWQKLLYGSGDWGLASTGMLRSVFYAIYITDVVGLDARIGSFAALIGVIW